MKILILDDLEELVDLLVIFLQKEEHETYTALKGEDALQVSNLIKFDLVISDLQMPGMDGIEFAYKFRQIQPDTPIIFFSSIIDGGQVYKNDFAAIENNILVEKDFNQLMSSVHFLLGKNLE